MGKGDFDKGGNIGPVVEDTSAPQPDTVRGITGALTVERVEKVMRHHQEKSNMNF